MICGLNMEFTELEIKQTSEDKTVTQSFSHKPVKIPYPNQGEM